MNQQHVSSKDITSKAIPVELSNTFSTILYAYYYIHMVLLSLLMSPNIMAAMSQIIWLKNTIFIANAITFIYCIYRLIKNKQMAIWCMNHMPNWMYRMMDRMPDWMHRRMNHNFMRIMMIGIDVMLAWMCLDFGLATIKK